MRSLYILALFTSVASLSAFSGGSDSSSVLTHLIVRAARGDSVPLRTIPILPRVQHRPKIGLVLTGGGARGMAQIGVLKVFEENHIPIDFIAATSIGSVVGGLYAAGWTAAEIESIAHATNWEEVLSLTDETKRSELFVDQKLAVDRSFLVLRFQGFQPVFPSAVSSGQRLTGLLNLVTLQAPYHPYHSFDDMKIPFRAVATDLVSGKRVVMGEGSLAEALRASATVPILFNPIERDSMQLVDGGLVSNVPVDVAKAQGCDLIIVANTTSGLRTRAEMNAPWETADQIMGIMMQHANQEQLNAADIIVTPDIGEHLSSDFQRLDTLIRRGEEAGLKAVSRILNQIAERKIQLAAVDGPEARRVFPNVRILCSGDSIPDSIWNHIRGEGRLGVVSLYEIRDHVNILSELGIFLDVEAVIDVGRDSTIVDYRVLANPRLKGVTFEGCRLIPVSELGLEFRTLIGRPMDLWALTAAVERAVRVYRTRGYSLARIDSFQFDAGSGVLHIGVNEGKIHRITVEGGVRTQDWFVLRDFPLQEGEVFEVDKANQGITNINSTALFEYVYLEVTYPPDGPVLTIRLKERPSQLMRFGVRVDNERKLQGSLDVRDENFRGTGMQLGLNLTGGPRNIDAALEFNARRLFNTYLTFGVSAFYKRLDSYYYEDAPSPGANQWERQIAGEYRDQRVGGSVAFGSQLERLGNVKAEFLAASVHVTDLRDVGFLEDHYQLRMIRVGTVIDTKNSYPFPTGGVGFNLSYEFALDILGGTVSYNALRVIYESFTPIVTRFTFHPKFTLGFADKSMPFSQEFRLGGQDNFFGLREDDRRGRQLLKANIEIRYRLPFRILWDAYLRARYDLATISDVPEAIKFTNLIHGVGGELAIDTPIGPALFAAGKSFYFSKDLPENPVQQGPWLFSFMIGYQI